ncbi:hypothetical protein [Fibrella forsythiae]|uniref:Uncharacterized protein n=1 Tax=Fibrella forsythiae TaxID=2817061 RepID=A0ABS3JFE6_9BACT|nr:hypothetical protein [Fibrella forsythiae]MBO0948726.1 hypothetical protein [Fibrella forsythiae]
MENHPTNDRDLSNVPTGMEQDPDADEQVIDQTNEQETNVPDDVNPSGLEKPTAEEGTGPEDDLANALAYALDGSGVGMAGAPPAAPPVGEPQKLTSEGITGAGPEDEEEQLTNDR